MEQTTDKASEQHGLKRELRLGDLVLMQVLLIVGLDWVGSAGKQGSTHVFLWLAGIVFFYIPLGAVAILLSRAMPLEGGTYQWVKAGVSPFAGYLAAWNSSFYTITVFGTFGPKLVNSLAYMAGPRGTWMMNSTPLIIGAAVACLLIVFAVNVAGLRLSKWIMDSGSILTVLIGVILVFLLIRAGVTGRHPAHAPFSPGIPLFSILTLNVFTKIAIGALSGFDIAGVFAGECRAASRDLPRSVWISGPLIAFIYILGTGALLVYIPVGKIDLAAPLQQVMQAGFGNGGLGQILVEVTVGALLLYTFAGALAMIGMTARLPMVIGWDGLLPEWWSHLHPKFRTPVKALAMVTGACILVAFVSSWGAGGQEIIQIGVGAATACLCIMYLLLFSVILFGKRLPDLRPGIGVRLAALSGFLVCAASLPFQIVPLAGVPNAGIFALKVGGLIVAINALGAWLYWWGKRRLLVTG
jgi:amino acid transporter